MDVQYDLTEIPSNGIRVLRVFADGAVSHVRVDVLTGSDDEATPVSYETAHLLEHMNGLMTSGRRPRFSEVAEELEGRGVVWNASVSGRRTSYFAYGPPEAFELMLTVVLDAFVDFRPDRSVFRQEKRAVVRELTRSGVGSILVQVHRQLLFPGHPRSSSLEDRIDGVRGLSLQDLADFRKDFYASESTLVTLASSESRIGADTLSAVAARLERVPRSRRVRPFPTLRRTGGRDALVLAHVAVPRLRAAKLLVSFFAPVPLFDERGRHALGAIAMLLSDGFSSRLFRALRSERGLAYSVASDASLDPLDPSMGTFTVQTSVAADDLPETVATVMRELASLARDGPKPGELEKYRNRAAFLLAERGADTHPRRWVVPYSLYTLWRKPVVGEAERNAAVLSVSAEDVRRTASDVFLRSPRVIVSYATARNRNADVAEALAEEGGPIVAERTVRALSV